MKIRISRRAYREIDSISNYFLSNNPAAGERLFGRIEDVLKLLRSAPLAGHATATAGIRTFAIPQTNFRIFYRIEGDTIAILSIFDGRREPRDAPK